MTASAVLYIRIFGGYTILFGLVSSQVSDVDYVHWIAPRAS